MAQASLPVFSIDHGQGCLCHFKLRKFLNMAWEISRNSKKCIDCEIDFNENDEFFSGISEDGEEFVRKDYCCPCWNDETKDKSQVFSFWKSKVPEKEKPSRPPIDTEAILSLFLKLEDEDESRSKINLRYVLALYLIRKRALKMKPAQTSEGKNTLDLYCPSEGRDIEVNYLDLTAEEIEDTTNEVKRLLDTRDFSLG